MCPSRLIWDWLRQNCQFEPSKEIRDRGLELIRDQICTRQPNFLGRLPNKSVSLAQQCAHNFIFWLHNVTMLLSSSSSSLWGRIWSGHHIVCSIRHQFHCELLSLKCQCKLPKENERLLQWFENCSSPLSTLDPVHKWVNASKCDSWLSL